MNEDLHKKGSPKRKYIQIFWENMERKIMESAREEFMRAFYSFSGYLDEQGYDRRKHVERREPVKI